MEHEHTMSTSQLLPTTTTSPQPPLPPLSATYAPTPTTTTTTSSAPTTSPLPPAFASTSALDAADGGVLTAEPTQLGVGKPPPPPPQDIDPDRTERRVQRWLEQQLDFEGAFGVRERDSRERVFGAGGVFGARGAGDESGGFRGEDEEGLGLGLGMGQAKEQEKEVKEERGWTPSKATAHSRSPATPTDSSAPELDSPSPSRADSPLLGFPSAESLLLLLPPALSRSSSRWTSAGAVGVGVEADSDAYAQVYGIPLVDDRARKDARRAHADARGESGVVEVVVDPLRRPGRHYVRALPLGADPSMGLEEGEAEEAAAVRYALYAGGYGDEYGFGEEEEDEQEVVVESAVHEQEGALRVERTRVDVVQEEALEFGAGREQVGAGAGVDGAGRDKPLPTLPSPSPSPPPLVHASAVSPVASDEAQAQPAPVIAKRISRRTSVSVHQQAYSSPSLQTHALPPSRAPSLSRSRRSSTAAQMPYVSSGAYAVASSSAYTHAPHLQTQAHSYHPGVSTSARHAQFAIGPGAGVGSGSGAGAAKARRASQSSLLGLGLGLPSTLSANANGGGNAGGSSTGVPLSRRPSLLRMPSLPLLGESAEPSSEYMVVSSSSGYPTEPSSEYTAGPSAGPKQVDLDLDWEEIPQPAQYHLPMAMQMRRSRSAAMLLASTSAGSASASSPSPTLANPAPDAADPGVLSSPKLLSLSSSLSSLSPLQPQSQASLQPQTSAHASPILQSSPLPPSAPPTRRSRAGSLGAAVSLSLSSLSLLPNTHSLSPNGYQAHNNYQAHSHAPSAGSISVSTSGSSGAGGIRDAVYIDSGEVRARLDRLLMGMGEGVGDVELVDDQVEDSPVSEPEQEMREEREDVQEMDERARALALAMADDDVDPDAANALRTPPSMVSLSSAYRRNTTAASPGASKVPPNTPMTPAYAVLPLPSAQGQSPVQGQGQHRVHHRAQRSHASLHSLHSAGRSSSHGSYGSLAMSASQSSVGSLSHIQQSQPQQSSQQGQHRQSPYSSPYQHAQASASQVYVGPVPVQAVGGLLSNHSPSASHSHSQGQSPRHSHNQSQSQSQSQQHSRAPSGASMPAAHSRGPSRAPSSSSRSRSRPPSVQALAHSRTSSVAPVGSAVHSRAGSVMHIPVPVRNTGSTGSGQAPLRPPPAPPLDVVELEMGLRVGLVGVDAEGTEEYVEEKVYGQEQEYERAGEEEGQEEEEMSDDERERFQFLRGLKLEGRMKEFGGVQFPSGLDDEESVGVEEGGVEVSEVGRYYEKDRDYDAGNDGFASKHTSTLAPAFNIDSSPRPAMQRSMSRWSLGSSTMDQPLDEPSSTAPTTATTTPSAGKKERKRKSFASPFGFGSGDAADGSLLSASAAATSSPTSNNGGKEKKRGRLASFISRLSGVGVSGVLPPTPASPPPLPMQQPPSSPTNPTAPPGLMPAPMIVEAGMRRMRSNEADEKGVVLVPGQWEHVHSPMQYHQQHYEQNSNPTSPAAALPNSMSVPSSPAGLMRNPHLPLPVKDIKPYPADVVLGGSLSAATARKFAGRAVAWDARVDEYPERDHTEKPRAVGGLRARANTSGDLLLLAGGVRRPALYKSASASVLGPAGVQRMPLGQMELQQQGHIHMQRRTPVPIHTEVAPYRGGPTVVVDDSLPPTPSSVASTEIDEDDEDDGEDYEDDEEEDDYGAEVHERSRIRREQEHEERWARLKMANDAAEGYRVRQQQPLPPIPQSPLAALSPSVALIESTLKALAPSPSGAGTSNGTVQQQYQGALVPTSDTRQRLKSMPSLALAPVYQHTAASPPASASTTNFSLMGAPLPSARSGKGSGFRGFVERMGLVGSSANTSLNNSPSSSYPSTPLSGAMPLQLSIPGGASSSTDVLNHFAPLGTRSPTHSPTTSLSLGPHKDGGVFTPGGLLGKKKPKRKLIISGVAPENVRGYEAVKRWCEAFGEVREMTRSSNGAVYVDFKKASVADTVCRIQAQVFIKGAGSVSLSWYTKKKKL